jgi:hypothetical protein
MLFIENSKLRREEVSLAIQVKYMVGSLGESVVPIRSGCKGGGGFT